MIPITVLRNLSKFEGCWYIVADLSVLLEDIAFIKSYIFGDEICKLLTPASVLSELEILRDRDPRGDDGHAGVAQRHITMLGAYARHMKFDASVHCEEEPASCDEATLRCCQQAMVHDMHVVLVTNKKAQRERARHAGVYAYTVSELRDADVVVRRRRLRHRRPPGSPPPTPAPHQHHRNHRRHRKRRHQ